FAIRDINPQATVHLLVIPKTEQYRDVTELAAGDPALMAEMVAVAQQLATEHANGEDPLLFNKGGSAARCFFAASPRRPGNIAAQSVVHVHAHVLGNSEEGKLVGF